MILLLVFIAAAIVFAGLSVVSGWPWAAFMLLAILGVGAVLEIMDKRASEAAGTIDPWQHADS